jgi:hypothetical protein
MSESSSAASEFEESVARLSESWMAMFQMPASIVPGPPPGIANGLLQMQQNMLGFARAFAEPMRLLAESQHELSKQVTAWADSQRDLAEIAAAWAQSQRKLSDLLGSWVDPGSPGQKHE